MSFALNKERLRYLLISWGFMDSDDRWDWEPVFLYGEDAMLESVVHECAHGAHLGVRFSLNIVEEIERELSIRGDEFALESELLAWAVTLTILSKLGIRFTPDEFIPSLEFQGIFEDDITSVSRDTLEDLVCKTLDLLLLSGVISLRDDEFL